ncbi:MAG TPA: prephenate dehydrogenase/arogenate dehydrogenase family protein [Chthoniobacterales bacterium]
MFAPGLIGASLGLALADRWRVRVWSRSESSAQAAARRIGAEFASADPVETAAGADGIVFCSPIDAMPALASAIAGCLKSEAVVTDAGSVKAAVVEKLEGILGPRYVGAHPMAGSEKSGLDAARKDLFQGAPCIVTPTPRSHAEALAGVEALWREAGCRIFRLSPREHDEAVACVSHLPHAVACCLVETLAARNPDWQKLAGSGYRDTTRVAAGAPEMWNGIFLENRREVQLALREMIAQLQSFSDLLERGDAAALRRLLEKISALRSTLSLSNESV